MSVQKAHANFSVNTICPIVSHPYEKLSTYQTASSISTTSNVNAGFSLCFPNDYAILQAYTAPQAVKCCGENSAYSYVPASPSLVYNQIAYLSQIVR